MAHAETRSDYDSQSERENTSKVSLDESKEAFTKKVHHTRFMEVKGGRVVNDSVFKPLQPAKLYDVRGWFQNLVPEDKLAAKYIGQGNRQPFHRQIVEYKIDNEIHTKDGAEKYLQGAVEAMASDKRCTGEVEQLVNGYNIILRSLGNIENPKYKHLVFRNISAAFNELAVHEEYLQARRIETLFDSNIAVDASIVETLHRVDYEISCLNCDYYRFKDSNNTSNIKLFEKTKSHVRAGVSEVNEKMAERKLVQVISQKDYDQNKAGFYAFTDSKDNGAHIGIYELFRYRADNEEYCLDTFKTKYGCKKAKGFGQDINGKKFADRKNALAAAIEYLTTELRQDDTLHIKYFKVHFHGSEAAKRIYHGNYFHLHPKIKDMLKD